jgi:hypothetical protein
MYWSCARTRGRSSGPVSLGLSGDLGGVDAAVMTEAGDQSWGKKVDAVLALPPVRCKS